MFKYFNEKQYILNYPDLRHFTTKKQAWKHYNECGIKENRTDQVILPKGVSFNELNGEKCKITIITPCCRPEKLRRIKESINFDYLDEWIIVYDESKVKSREKQFDDCKISEYYHTSTGISGNPQRNYGLSQIKNEDTFIYYLDDDNIIHPDLYKLLNVINKDNFYTFNQLKGHLGNNIKTGYIDTAMFLIYYPLIKGLNWVIDKYEADGLYISNVYNLNKDKWIYVNNIYCYYNYSKCDLEV